MNPSSDILPDVTGKPSVTARRNTFSKSERICSKRVIDQLFAGGNQSMAVFPLRAVYKEVSDSEEPNPVSVLISVSKRHFRHAVDRNRMKRQIREAYRTNKHTLSDTIAARGTHLYIAFICISDELCATQKVTNSVRKILARISERMQTEE